MSSAHNRSHCTQRLSAMGSVGCFAYLKLWSLPHYPYLPFSQCGKDRLARNPSCDVILHFLLLLLNLCLSKVKLCGALWFWKSVATIRKGRAMTEASAVSTLILFSHRVPYVFITLSTFSNIGLADKYPELGIWSTAQGYSKADLFLAILIIIFVSRIELSSSYNNCIPESPPWLL